MPAKAPTGMGTPLSSTLPGSMLLSSFTSFEMCDICIALLLHAP